MIAKFELNERGLSYDVKSSFFERVRNGRHWKRGFIPLAHLSAIEVSRGSVLPGFLSVIGIGLAGFGGIRWLITVQYYWEWQYRYGVDWQAPLAIGLVLLFVQIAWTTTWTTFYNDGKRIFECDLDGDQREKLLNHYIEITSGTTPNG